MKRLLSIVGGLVALSTALPAAAQFRKPDDAIKYRQSVMTLQGYHFGRPIDSDQVVAEWRRRTTPVTVGGGSGPREGRCMVARRPQAW